MVWNNNDCIERKKKTWLLQIAVSLTIYRVKPNLNELLQILTWKRLGGRLKKKNLTNTWAIFLVCVVSGSVDIARVTETANYITILASSLVELS